MSGRGREPLIGRYTRTGTSRPASRATASDTPGCQLLVAAASTR
jgi:hypothetical protein